MPSIISNFDATNLYGAQLYPPLPEKNYRAVEATLEQVMAMASAYDPDDGTGYIIGVRWS